MRPVQRSLILLLVLLASGPASAQCVEPTNQALWSQLVRKCPHLEDSLKQGETEKPEGWFTRNQACSCHPSFVFLRASTTLKSGLAASTGEELKVASDLLKPVSLVSAFNAGATCGDGEALGVSGDLQVPAWWACRAASLRDAVRVELETRAGRKGTISVALENQLEAGSVEVSLCDASGTNCEKLAEPVRRDPGTFRIRVSDEFLAEPEMFSLAARGQVIAISRRDLAPPATAISAEQKARYAAALDAARKSSWIEARKAFESIQPRDAGTLFNIGYTALKGELYVYAWESLSRATQGAEKLPDWLMQRAATHLKEAEEQLAFLEVRLPENASLRVDGQRLKRVGAGRVWTLGNSGGSPPSAFSLMVRRGDHSFEVWHGNLVEKKENRNVTGAKGTIDVTKSAPPPVVDEGPGLQPLDWGLIGGGTAALVTSGVLAVAGQNKRAEAEDLCPNDQCDTDEGNDAVASGKGLMTGSAIAALVGVGALAWEVVRLTEERPKERPPEPIWNLTIGSAGLQSWSLVTGGRF